MNTHRFHNELPLLSHKGKILKAADVGVVSHAMELLEAAKNEEQKKRYEIQEEWQRQKEAGFRQGKEEARRQLIVHYWKTVTSTIEYLETMQEQMADAIVRAVRTLIQSAPPAERAIQLATGAVERLRQQAWVVLCLHPDDVDSVNRLLEDWKIRLPRNMRVETRASEEVGRGDCVLESPIGRVDASLETQINIIQEQLKNTL
jgi:type III secretion protein L